ncbi:CPBP family intramembrane glutamic endopeptidase [Bacillus testis]|uniref:CPBP family intramembrane glutamic endopeptidase n=1 Tax=Bacillus testis TaxID=1622072 RepID=UPI00067EB9B2|nr:CPBP family intramembrane glutamic endopeptidase [Bacillus testis]
MRKFIQNKYIWVFVTYLLIFIFVPYGMKFILYLLEAGPEKDVSFGEYHLNSMMVLVINILLLLIILAYISVLYQKTSLFQWRKPKVKGKDFLYAVFVFLGGKMIAAVFLIIISFFFDFNLEFTSRNQDAVEEMMRTSYIAFFHITILAPIIEEFFFRKIIIGHIFSQHKYVGLIISSLLFGGMHVVTSFTLIGMIIYSSIGFSLGLVYIKTNRLEASVVAHSFNNLIPYLLLLIVR